MPIPTDLKIGIIGNGVVGNATARTWMEHAEVRVYDKLPARRTHSWGEVTSCHVLFLCLPTPPLIYSSQETPSGVRGCDISAVDEVCLQLHHDAPDATIALRSTVPVGTTKRLRHDYGLLNLVHNPEFLTARCAVTDAQLPARNILGGEVITGTDLRAMYETRFPGVPVHSITSDESEAVKLFQNSFFAVKVAFFNELYAYANQIGLNWQRVLEGMLSDGRIAHSHTKVPGPDGKFGFGGACLPKDLANLVCSMNDAGVSPFVGNAAHVRNQFDRGVDAELAGPYLASPNRKAS